MRCFCPRYIPLRAATAAPRHPSPLPKPLAVAAAQLPMTNFFVVCSQVLLTGVSPKEAKRLITHGAIVTTSAKAGSYAYDFTQEEVDKYELMHAARDRAAARKKEIHAGLPTKKENLNELEKDVSEMASSVKSKGPIEESLSRFFDSIQVCQETWNNAFVGDQISRIFKTENLTKLWAHLRNVYTDTAKCEDLIALIKPLFEDFAEFLPLVRCARMLTSEEKTRTLELCKKLPRDFHERFPERGVTVKMFMTFYELHDFVEKWGTIGMFNEDAFEARRGDAQHEAREKELCVDIIYICRN